MQNILMKFDPATGKERPYPSHAAQWRNWHGVAAWLFDPWTGKRRNAYDVGSDVHGLLIVPAGTLGGDMLDAWLDDPEMIAEARGINAAMAGGEHGQ